MAFYTVQFSKNLCDVKPNDKELPIQTVELKLAWRVIDSNRAHGWAKDLNEKSNFYTVDAQIVGEGGKPINDGKPMTMGLIGFHLAINTPDHPEMVWATYEHKDNTVDCSSERESSAKSFLSPTCTACIAYPQESECFKQCRFNQAQKEPADHLRGKTTNICRVFPNGTAKGDLKADENKNAIKALNEGAKDALAELKQDKSGKYDSMAVVLENYFNVGALWVNDPSKKSGSPEGQNTNQRGSLQLANTVMETVEQGKLENMGSQIKAVMPPEGVENCFACHQYVPKQTATSGLSHIIDDIIGHPNAK